MAVVGFNPAQEFLQTLLESGWDPSPEVEEALEVLQDQGGVSPFFVFAGLFFSLIIDSLFGAVGGIIGAALFRKRGTATK